jgi:hypothetical protein
VCSKDHTRPTTTLSKTQTKTWEFGGNNGNKTGAMHGPLIDEGISLRCFCGISLLGGLFVFAGIFLLLLYSSLQMGVIDSPCAFITHLEVSVFFFSSMSPDRISQSSH